MSEPERILELTRAVHEVATNKIQAIKRVTGTTRILSLNALIEATRAGEAGKGFAVVAGEVKNVSHSIDSITQALEGELSASIRDLMTLGESMVTQLRGARLADLALNMIEIIDRNLYERSCDVRWWATDAAVVDCVGGDGAAIAHASRRLGVILDSYTVYLDLWVADANGRVLANGRPERYPGVAGASVAGAKWFSDAMATGSGGEYSMADIAVNPALDNAMVATYATAIREGGEADGRPIGVLGIFFDWRPQAEGVVKAIRVREEEKPRTRALLVDRDFKVLAASDGVGVLSEVLRLDTQGATMGAYVDEMGAVVGYALTPGYETYAGMGWYGVIVQQPPASAEASRH